jgi:hypothetical protein
MRANSMVFLVFVFVSKYDPQTILQWYTFGPLFLRNMKMQNMFLLIRQDMARNGH